MLPIDQAFYIQAIEIHVILMTTAQVKDWRPGQSRRIVPGGHSRDADAANLGSSGSLHVENHSSGSQTLVCIQFTW